MRSASYVERGSSSRQPLMPGGAVLPGAPGRYRVIDSCGRQRHVFVFPYSHHKPFGLSEFLIGSSIAIDVQGQFLCPPLGICLWKRPMVWARVPEAPIHEDGDFRWPEDDICSTAHTRQDTSINTEAQTHAVKVATQFALGLSVSLTLSSHPHKRVRRRGRRWAWHQILAKRVSYSLAMRTIMLA